MGRARSGEPRPPVPQQPERRDVVHRQRSARPMERRPGPETLPPAPEYLPPRRPHAPRDAGHGRPRRRDGEQHGRGDGHSGIQLPAASVRTELPKTPAGDDPRQRNRLDDQLARHLQIPGRAPFDAPLRRPPGVVVRRGALRMVESARGRLHPARRPPLLHGRIRLDRIRLPGRTHPLLLRLAEPLVARRHHRPGGHTQGPLLALPQQVEPRSRNAPHTAPLELEGTRRRSHPRIHLHELPRSRTVHQRQETPA